MGRFRIKNRLFKVVVGIIFFGAFLAGGSYAIYKFATELPLAIASNGWPSVAGARDGISIVTCA